MNIFIKTVFFLLLSSLLSSAKDLSFTGFGSAGLISYDRNIVKGISQESYYNAKFQANIKVNKKIDAQLDFRGNSFDQDVELREFSVKFKYYDYIKIKFGNIKLPFGQEQLINRENLATINRSSSQENISNQGYGGRSVGIQAYYKYSEKRADFPFSYFVNLYKNNSFQTGAVMRAVYHFNKFNIGANYQVIHRGGRVELEFNAHGYGFDAGYEGEAFNFSAGAYLVRNLDLSLQNISYNEALKTDQISGNERDEQINGASLQLTAAYKYHLDGEIIKYIEPLYLFSAFIPDMDQSESQELQNVAGVNIYFSKKVRLRLQADMRQTKSQYASKYATLGSRGIFELQVRF